MDHPVVEYGSAESDDEDEEDAQENGASEAMHDMRTEHKAFGMMASMQLEDIPLPQPTGAVPPHKYADYYIGVEGDAVETRVYEALQRMIVLKLELSFKMQEAFHAIKVVEKEGLRASEQEEAVIYAEVSSSSAPVNRHTMLNREAAFGAQPIKFHEDKLKALFILVEEMCVLLLPIGWWAFSNAASGISDDQREMCKLEYVSTSKYKMSLLSASEIKPLMRYAKDVYGLIAW